MFKDFILLTKQQFANTQRNDTQHNNQQYDDT